MIQGKEPDPPSQGHTLYTISSVLSEVWGTKVDLPNPVPIERIKIY